MEYSEGSECKKIVIWRKFHINHRFFCEQSRDQAALFDFAYILVLLLYNIVLIFTLNLEYIHKIASSKIEKFAYHTAAQVATMFWNENHDILT